MPNRRKPKDPRMVSAGRHLAITACKCRPDGVLSAPWNIFCELLYCSSLTLRVLSGPQISLIHPTCRLRQSPSTEPLPRSIASGPGTRQSAISLERTLLRKAHHAGRQLFAYPALNAKWAHSHVRTGALRSSSSILQQSCH